MAVAEARRVQAVVLQLHDPAVGAYRACALCTHGDERGMHCFAPLLHAGPCGLPSCDVRGTNGACGPHGLLLELS